ncbi:YncE family protein [Symbioplanes lichenis]|uniref:YncE family protein n=1 Tax=Symbioplanes lichenis TaxID=1629072 RepID=UPI00273A3450|nr:hypothetical protein [Actinoplanes lichenis]
MKTLPCGHVAHAATNRLCRHLLPATIDYHALLTGRGLEADYCCADCLRAAERGEAVPLVPVCEGCYARYADDEDGQFSGWHGEPGIAERPEPVGGRLLVTPLPDELGTVLDIAGVPSLGRASLGGQQRAGGSQADWLVLTADARLVLFDPASGTCEEIATDVLTPEADERPWVRRVFRHRLHVSDDGRFAAVVNDRGHHGRVVDLGTGRVTMTLHGGDYHPEEVPFSLAFTVHAGRTVVVHRTDWNRLDVSDPATGERLTPPGREGGYQDYFHGALYPSPTGRWLADDGWVWAPCGLVTAWEMTAWLGAGPPESADRGNPEEPGDGLSVQDLCQRWYGWNQPMCWIADDLFAVGGIGDDEERLLAGVRIFDLAAGTEVRAFAGPRGPLFGVGRRLYAAAPAGLEIWDPFTGHRTGRVPGFVPTALHRAAQEFAAVDGRRLLRLSIAAQP